MTPILITVQPFNPSTGLRETVRLASALDASAYGINALNWIPGISQRPTITVELMSMALDGKVQATTCQFAIDLNALASPGTAAVWKWKGAPVVVYAAPDLKMPVSPSFTGIVDSPTLDLDKLSLSLSCTADVSFLEGPLLTGEFSGAGGIDGEAEVRGTLFPAGFGFCENIPPVWFDKTNWIGLVDGYGNTIDITRLTEGLDDRGPAQADYANYDDLVAAIVAKDVAPGQWATSKAWGLVGLGAPPVEPIGVDALFGSGSTGLMAERVLTIHRAVDPANVDLAALSAIDVAVPYPTHYWTADQRDCRDLLESIAAAANATPVVLPQGIVTMTRGVTGAAVATLDRSGSTLPRVTDWKSAEPTTPVWRLDARAERPAGVTSASDVLYVDDIIDKGGYDPLFTYRAGNVAWSPDHSSWLYISDTPDKGHAPPAWPVEADAYWENMTPPPLYADGTPFTDLKPNDPGATRNVPAQLLKDGVFLDEFWTAANEARSFPYDQAPSGYALEIPFADGLENFSSYGGLLDAFMEIHPGKTLWIRFNANTGAHVSVPVTSGGVPVTSGGVPITAPEFADGDWDLHAAMDWFAADGTRLVTTDPAEAALQDVGVLYLDFAGGYYRTDAVAAALDDLPGYAYARAGAKFELDAANHPVSFAAGVPGIVAGYGYFSRDAVTNLLLKSQAIDDPVWGTTNLTVTADAAAAPDGTMTADLIARTAFAGNHLLRQGYAIPVGTTATVSIFAKAATAGNMLGILCDSAPNPGRASVQFDLVNGVIAAGPTATNYTNVAAAIISCGAGWFRCSLTFTVVGNDAARLFFGPSDNTNNAGNWYADTPGVLDDCYVWGAQLVVGPAAGPYIPTDAAAVTLGPDTLAVSLPGDAAVPVTNLLIKSQAFDDAAWATLNLNVAANAIAAPDGTMTADALTRTATASNHNITQALATLIPIGSTATVSFFARAKSVGNQVGVRCNNSFANRASAVFDLAAGVVVGTEGTQYTGIAASISALADGWYRCSMTFTVATAAANSVIIGPTDASRPLVGWNGDSPGVLSDCYVWGAQIVFGPAAGPYIPTDAAAVTADVDDTSHTASFTFDDGSVQDVPVTVVNDVWTLPTYPSVLHRKVVRSVFLGDDDAEIEMFQRTDLASVTPYPGERTLVASVTPPALARRARLLFGHPISTGFSGSWAVHSAWVAEHQPSADVTGENAPTMALGPNQSVAYQSDGVTPQPGELPRTLVNKRFLGGLEVTAAADWTADFDGMTATIDNDPASALRGAVTVTSIEQDAASATITSTYDGVPLTNVQVWTKDTATPLPPASSSSLAVDVSTTVDSAQTAYGPVSAAGTVTLAAGQTLSTTLPLHYSVTAGAATIAGKWQYAVAGSGVWTDFGPESVGTSATKIKWYEPEEGSLYVNQDVAGLAAGDYDVQLLLRHYGGTSDAPGFGTATIKAH